MSEVVNHKVMPRPPRPLNWSFDMRPFGSDLILKSGTPKGFPPDVRRAQTLQVCFPDGTPKTRPNGKLLFFTYGEVLSDLKELKESDDPDPGLITAFSSFLSAVDEVFPLTLDELVSTHGLVSIANIMGISPPSLRNRMTGRAKVQFQELAAIKERFPGFDLETTVRTLANRKEYR
jgi:hypothetical protein